MVTERQLPGRSQLIAELIRHDLADPANGKEDGVFAGTITLIYKAESGRVRHALAKLQSEFLKEVISSQHVFLEDDKSLEVLLVQGSYERLSSLCDRLRSVRGVEQLKLVTTRTLLPPLHVHSDNGSIT
jgi:CopG family nickel-responsive transcriptional regulator